VLLVVCAVLFVVSLFLVKNKSLFKNEESYADQKANQLGLTYNNEILGNLVNKDTDGDGVSDWEEGLWGTDSRKKDTNDDGTPDNVEIENLKLAQNGQSESLNLSLEGNEENLTETDKFSREFFATVATLNQNGAMDQATADKLSASLAEQIQNSAPRKIFTLSDIKVSANDNTQALENYSNSLISIQKKYPINYTVMDVLQKFIIDENNVDSSILVELDPIIGQTNKIIADMAKMSVPQSLASLHLDFMNGLQRLVENLEGIKLYETDVIVSLSAISQYDQNTIRLDLAINNLTDAIAQKLNN